MANVFDLYPKLSYEDKGLINPIIEERPDICPHCRAQRVELFSFNGYPQNYRDAVDAYLRGYNIEYNKYEIRTMKCKSCNKEFVIDWSSGFPRPLRDVYKTNRFFSEFSLGV